MTGKEWFKEGYEDRRMRRGMVPPDCPPERSSYRNYMAGWNARVSDEARHAALCTVPLHLREEERHPDR